MEQTLEIRQHVIFVDSQRRRRDALVTQVHSNGRSSAEYKDTFRQWPCINLVTVVLDENRTDPYGEQIERFSSVSHASTQPVRMGMYFLLPGEE